MIFRWLRRGRNQSPREPPSRGGPKPTPQPPREYKEGDLIGGYYRVLRAMKGGMAAAYVVERDGDFLVLKTPLVTSKESLEAFRAEAEVWVRLGRHPNIVSAYWVEEIAQQLFVGVEYIEPNEAGLTSLTDFSRHGILHPVFLARLTADSCYALSFANQRGLVCHRDVKPDNLLIGQGDRLKITDFGLARAVVPSTPTVSPESLERIGGWASQDGGLAGTVPYMAPEQILGHRLDARTDLYGFGISLFELSFGRLPFRGRTAHDLFQAHLKQRPEIPEHPFADLIERCLRKSPGERYQNPDALLAALRETCRAAEIPLPPPPIIDDSETAELRTQAHSLAKLGRLDEALAAARRLVDQQPNDASAWTQLGRLLHECGFLDEANAATVRSLEIDPTRSPPLNNLGIILGRRGDIDGAIAAFNRALLADPTNIGAMMNLAPKLADRGEHGKGIQLLERAHQLAADRADVLINLGGLSGLFNALYMSLYLVR